MLVQLRAVMEQRLGPLTISTAQSSLPEHGTGTLDKAFRPCWLNIESSLGKVSLFLKAPHNAEPEVYTILEELDILAPRLWGVLTLEGEEICVLDDCGRLNLAELPGNSINYTQHTPAPVMVTLANLHARSWGRTEAWGSLGRRDTEFYLGRLGRMDLSGWEQSPYREGFAANLELLSKSRTWLKENLPWVFQGTWALTHGDASAVNVALAEDGYATLVDWGDSRVSTCLFDLPQLVNTPPKFRLWYDTLAGQCSGVPSHDELYAKYLGAALFFALAGCAGRLTGWKQQFAWMPREYMKVEAMEQQFSTIRDIYLQLGPHL